MADVQLPPALAGDERFAWLCELLDEALAGVDLSAMAVYLVDQVNAALLPHLADQLSLLDESYWLLAESDQARRDLIKGSAAIHRYKGTPWAVREVVRQLGFGDATLQEGIANPTGDGRDPTTWAGYRILLHHTINRDQAALLRRLLLSVAPARCRLSTVDFIPLRHNGAARRDGHYNRGSY